MKDLVMIKERNGRLLRSLMVCLLLLPTLSGCGPSITVPALVPDDIPQLEARANRHQGEHYLEPGDAIRLRFPFHEEMNQELTVEPNGEVLTQVVGPIKAAGLTTQELQTVILDRSSVTLRDPEVMVTLVGFALKQIYISGEVGRPRAIEYRDGLTPLHAISEAGGFLYTARLDSVILIRKGHTADDFISRKLNLAKVLSEGKQSPFHLAPNDILFIPKTPIAHANIWVRQHITNLIPVRPPTTRLPGTQ